MVIKGAFTKEQADQWTETMWIRLGLDPNDKSTWDRERVHMPWHKREVVAKFAPKVRNSMYRPCIIHDPIDMQAWDAIQDLLGGEERIDEVSSSWGDSFIVNFGTPEMEKSESAVEPQNLNNWHVDGDFFVHYLDSPEQALLVIPIFSDIEPSGGGTFIAPDGIDLIANYLAAHPEGVLPISLSFVSSTSTKTDPKDDPSYWSHLEAVKRCNNFVEMSGEVGDVVLLHPLMLHSASRNHLRIPRIITNPPVALREPFKFDRENPEDYSLVERKTLRALGVDRLDFKPTTERRTLVPKRVDVQNDMLEQEKRRLAEAALLKSEGLGAQSLVMKPIPVV